MTNSDDDSRNSQREQLALVPGVLYASARQFLAAGTPMLAAKWHERGLMLDLVLVAPMLSRCLGSINLREDILDDNVRGTITIFIHAERTKKGIEVISSIPTDVSLRVKRHLAEYRPFLKGSDSDWLFPSPNGGPKSPIVVRHAIHRTLTEALSR
jgi:hypothetical protein